MSATTDRAARADARKHLPMTNPIGTCACGPCTRYDWEATPDDGMSLAEFRRTFYPEAWA